MTTLKTCSKCKTERPIEEFYKSTTIACGYHSACRHCYQAHARNVHAKSREVVRDDVDWWRMTTYLKSSRVPIANRKKAELIAEWNDLTNWYVPRMSQRQEKLISFALEEY